MYRFRRLFFFFLKTAKIHRNGYKVQWTGKRKMATVILWREYIRVKIYPGFGFMNIYRNITYILYLFLFVRVLKGLPCVLLRARPCPKTSPTSYWQGLDDGSLTCTLTGWNGAFNGNSSTPLWNNTGGLGKKGARCRGPTQSDNRQIYFNLKNNVHIVKFYVSKLC